MSLQADPGAFTCLLPVWAGDHPALFTEALESVAGGSLAPTEILICEDGALPEALEAAVSLGAARFGARRVPHHGVAGLHNNLNHAMQAVATPWACRADADDVNLPGRFAAQVGYLREHPEIAALGGSILEIPPGGGARRRVTPLAHRDIVRWARLRNPINHMTAFFQTAAFRACGGYPDLPLKEDYGLWLRMIARGYRLANLPEDLVRVRLGPNFVARRSGLKNLGSEYGLYQLKRRIPGMGGPAAFATMVARAGALAVGGIAAVAYDRVLRR